LRGPGTRRRPAAFVDRDGTVIHEREYLADPDGVELVPGAAEGLRALQDAGYAVVIVSNQSGIARGYYDEAQYRRVQQRMEQELAAAGVSVLDRYHCPHHPDFTGPCECRKPAPGLFLRAIREHGLDPAASVWVGDRIRDVEAARSLGGMAVLVRTGYGRQEASRAPDWVAVVDDLKEAATWVLGRAEGVDSLRPRG